MCIMYIIPVYIYIYIYIHICVYIHTDAYCTCVCVHVIYIYIHISIYLSIYLSIYIICIYRYKSSWGLRNVLLHSFQAFVLGCYLCLPFQVNCTWDGIQPQRPQWPKKWPLNVRFKWSKSKTDRNFNTWNLQI